MNRRKFIKLAGSGLAASAFPAGVGADAEEFVQTKLQMNSASNSASPPNILWICTDQQRWDTIGALNNPYIKTPNLDRLVANGVAFTHAHCQSPICTPSRSSFLTGRHPTSINACINGNDRWMEMAPLVTTLLRDGADYRCGLAGKFHLAGNHRRTEPRPKDDGYEDFWHSHAPQEYGTDRNAYHHWLNDRGHDYRELKQKYGYVPAELHQTTWCGNVAVDFIRDNADARRPWLFSFNCYDPHGPFDPPREYVDRYDIDSLPGPAFRDSDIEHQRRLEAMDINFQSVSTHPDEFNGKSLQAHYWGQIDLIDENVGRMLKALEETGQLENTVIVFTSDHGDMCGDHGLRAKGCRFYEGLVRVPLIVSCPGRFQSGLRSDALVELTDLAPTLLELNGLPLPEKCEGKSILPILTGDADPREHRDEVRCEFYEVLQGPPTRATMLRTRKWKVVSYHGHAFGELYDMENDPREFRNLWEDPEYADVKVDMLRRNFDGLAMAVDLGSRRVGRY